MCYWLDKSRLHRNIQHTHTHTILYTTIEYSVVYNFFRAWVNSDCFFFHSLSSRPHPFSCSRSLIALLIFSAEMIYSANVYSECWASSFYKRVIVELNESNVDTDASKRKRRRRPRKKQRNCGSPSPPFMSLSCTLFPLSLSRSPSALPCAQKSKSMACVSYSYSYHYYYCYCFIVVVPRLASVFAIYYNMCDIQTHVKIWILCVRASERALAPLIHLLSLIPTTYLLSCGYDLSFFL